VTSGCRTLHWHTQVLKSNSSLSDENSEDCLARTEDDLKIWCRRRQLHRDPTGLVDTPAQILKSRKKARPSRASGLYFWNRNKALYEHKKIGYPHCRVRTVRNLIRERPRANAQTSWICSAGQHIALVRQAGNGNVAWRKLERQLASPSPR